MGSTYTVAWWDYKNKQYQQYWAGENLAGALFNLWKAKREHPNCVRLHWR